MANSEWIYWEVIGLMSGVLGVLPLSVHTILTQVCMFLFMILWDIGVALCILMCAILPQSVSQSKQLVAGCLCVSVVLSAGVLSFVGVPLSYYLSIYLDGGLGSLWTWINLPYMPPLLFV